jgi:hypothetical protein
MSCSPALILLFIFWLPINAVSQEQQTVLLFSHQAKDKFRYLEEGKRIQYRLAGDEKKHRGRISDIGASSMTVNGVVVPYQDVAMIRAFPIGMSVARISGAVLVSAGAVLFATGLVILIQGLGSDGCTLFFSLVVSAVFGAGGLALGILGGIPLLIGGKKFEIPEKWKLQAATLNKGGRQKTLEPILTE